MLIKKSVQRWRILVRCRETRYRNISLYQYFLSLLIHSNVKMLMSHLSRRVCVCVVENLMISHEVIRQVTNWFQVAGRNRHVLENLPAFSIINQHFVPLDLLGRVFPESSHRAGASNPQPQG